MRQMTKQQVPFNELTPEIEANLDERGDWRVVSENQKPGYTESPATPLSETGENQISPPWLSRKMLCLTPFVAPWQESEPPPERKD